MGSLEGQYNIQRDNRQQASRSEGSDGDISPLSSRKVSLADAHQQYQQDYNQPISPRHQERFHESIEEQRDLEDEDDPISHHQGHHHQGHQGHQGQGHRLSSVPFSYKGFHQAGKNDPIPPLAHPIKPNRGKKSFFGKFINSINDKSSRHNSSSSESSSGGGGSNRMSFTRSNSKHRTPSILNIRSSSYNDDLGPLTPVHQSQGSQQGSQGSQAQVQQGAAPPPSSQNHPGVQNAISSHPMVKHNPSITSSFFDMRNDSTGGNSVVALNVNDLNDMTGIVAEPPQDQQQEQQQFQQQESQGTNDKIQKDSWTAPESWDVKGDKLGSVSDDDDEYVVRKTLTTITQLDEQRFDSKNYHIRIYGEDDDFTSTLKRPYMETVDELIRYIKGRYQLVGDYKLSLRVGKVTKKLEWNQKPIKIQTNLLFLSGYLESDRLDEIGRDDLSYLFKFILHHDVLKQLSPLEEEQISRDLLHVNLKSKDLQKIPALCYSPKVQSLDVSNNGDITLPLDFFQTANSQLSNLRMVNIRAKNFPQNIVYAKELASLDLERNFITKFPMECFRLKNLSTLNLRCNKLSELPDLPPNLRVLDISSNEFESYPESVNKLNNLLQLDLSYNKLQNLPESVNNLKNMRKLNISSNYLTFVDINLLNLRTLNLRYNDITEIHLHDSNIETLYLTHNNISNIADPLNSLKTLDLQQNPVTQLNIKSPELRTLNLSKAKLTFLPDVILTFTKLEKLELSKNALRELPSTLVNLKNLKDLSIYGNNLEILPDLSPLTKLKNLDLHDNNLKSIFDFSFIESVNISSNLISELPSPQFSDLIFFRAGDNRLNDDCFYTIKHYINLKILSLAYNRLVDIPAGTLGNCKNIDQLYLSGNALTTLPEDFEDIATLRVLCLNGNRFRTLPSELSKLYNMEVIDVGSNELKYNTSNSKYEWNWKSNINLRYLNLSGNKKLEITEDLNLPRLRLLGLMDLTLTTQAIPDESMEVRVRTTPSTIGNMSYGISDRVNKYILSRDSVIEKIAGGILIGLFDGINSGKISHIIRENFHKIFEQELNKFDIVTALRHTFLSLNKVINFSSLNSEDGLTGSSVTVIFIKEKKIYTANIGDSTAMLAKTDGSFTFLTVNHQPSSVVEFERIRTSGGFVSNDDKLDGVSKVSRAAGFSDLLPHIHSGPDISEAHLHDEVLVLGTRELFEYLPTKTIGDIVRESDNPMVTAEKLRDYAISYGCNTKTSAIVLSLKKAKKDYKPPAKQQVEDSNLRRLRPEIQPPVGELAMVFTDIKNSTLLWENYPLAMRSAIRTHNDIMRRQLHIVGGYEVKTEGDAFMVSFPTVSSAMVWCFNVQQQLLLEDWPAEITQSDEGREVKDSMGNTIYKGLSVRMGIHWGVPVCEPDIITRRMDYFGPMVNKTARVCGVADGGEITLTLDCLTEFKRIEAAHKLVLAGSTLEQAFGPNEAAESLNNECAMLTNIGWRLEAMGRVQLKGLETEEEISLIFPQSLGTRFGFQRKPDLTAEDIYRLRDITLRLDYILSKVSGFQSNFQNVKKNEHLDKNLFENFIARIESSIALLSLRDQTIGLFEKETDLFNLVDQLSTLYKQARISGIPSSPGGTISDDISEMSSDE
ncbi:Adenylate cyclase [Wickerhamomyces ciferrii]|uniref:Adenylate cyclase n=1 Tax=Wickerhamomyces ciferrii (strain ATCC 14091 / BCRC 22168 / CBS 111 / JCM 3599 / NBRC 0793 / NRRL Y-1031 F-60-10) TaxID=1206466 RepID=K0KID8_WICCF|nr:Adenylate cyclase [Wickerhamomyces ciferrii]CCH41937.1 Adenylate cyclase [Wickerhamomyces ciferrii]